MPRSVLVDLPLDPFLRLVSDDANLPTSRTGSKRSRSSSLARSIFTPVKRRILEHEGAFPPSQSRSYPSTSTHSLSPHRNVFLHAFDTPKCPLRSSPAYLGDTLPSPPCHLATLVPPLPCELRRISPRLSSSPQCKPPSSPTTTPTRTSPRKTRSQTTSTPSPPTPTGVMMIPREMPPQPDRRSVHYPGFDVHLDTHIALPSTRSKVRAKAEAARVREDGDAAKENVRPMATDALSKVKVKGDVAPRRSARLRTNNNGCAPSQKVVVAPEARSLGRRRNTLHDPSLQL